MKETAFICNNATERSLVLVDELGRATSNEDGVAIAWSVSEYLLKRCAMTFFVTHYPQLSSLATIYPSVQNIHLEASVSQGLNGEIRYTHKAMPGACSVSTDYGVKLASACGWPMEVVDNAGKIQEIVEGMLPDESLCHPRPLQQLSESRTKAYQTLGHISQELQEIISDGKIQSIESIRSDLMSMQQRHIPSSDIDLIDAMDQLLFRNLHNHKSTNGTATMGDNDSVNNSVPSVKESTRRNNNEVRSPVSNAIVETDETASFDMRYFKSASSSSSSSSYDNSGDSSSASSYSSSSGISSSVQLG
jgi:dsDNA-specific endonuclease/ATPase MutS2